MPSPAPNASHTPYRTADTQPLPIGDPSAPQEAPASPRRKALTYWIGGLAAVLILAGVAVSYWKGPSVAPGDGASQPQPEVPPSLRPYYERAQAGDASAMRMLGTMYYNGLNVAPDTKEGIRWYRKAAAAGSVAAMTDLEQLGLGQDEST